MSDETTSSYYPAETQKTSTLAIVSLIAGIAGWTILPLIGSLTAIITGHLAKAEIRDHAGQISGDGFATAGLIMGYLSLALGLCICIFIFGILLFAIPISRSVSGLPELLLLIS